MRLDELVDVAVGPAREPEARVEPLRRSHVLRGVQQDREPLLARPLDAHEQERLRDPAALRARIDGKQPDLRLARMTPLEPG